MAVDLGFPVVGIVLLILLLKIAPGFPLPLSWLATAIYELLPVLCGLAVFVFAVAIRLREGGLAAYAVIGLTTNGFFYWLTRTPYLAD